MIEAFILGTFCLFLLLCLIFDLSILYALAAGLLLFWIYGKSKGYTWHELADMSLSGIKTVKNILITFVLIGMLTALWRASGTIPVIVCYASGLIRPAYFLVMTFLLNCLVSILTGTSFGTAATMGVICATMGTSLNINPLLIGGAVLSGIYFGDRCSPVSTSALLVAELTKTDIFCNIRNMLHSALVPFLLSCGIYLLIGLLSAHNGTVPDLALIFGTEFSLHIIAVLPAAIILILSLFKINVKITMTVSILLSIPICMLLQHTSITELPTLLLNGYRAADSDVAAMLNGGGIRSMIKVGAIVCLSSSYSGIFQKTGLLDQIQKKILAFAERTTPYAAILLTSVVSGMIACNQTLTIMLTHQLCGQLRQTPKTSAAQNGNFTRQHQETLALWLEDSAVVIAPLVPWSIAGAVPLASIGAPSASVLLACFLYLLPLWRLVTPSKN